MKLRDLMTPDPWTLEPEMTLRDAVERLVDFGVSGAPVVSIERLVGVLSVSDIVEYQSSSPVPRRHEDEEWSVFQQWEADRAGAFSGFFRSAGTEAGAEMLGQVGDGAPGGEDMLAEQLVGDVMTRMVLALSPDADVVEAAKLMAERGVHRLVVTEGETLQGIVSSMDFIRAIAEGKLGPVT